MNKELDAEIAKVSEELNKLTLEEKMGFVLPNLFDLMKSFNRLEKLIFDIGRDQEAGQRALREVFIPVLEDLIPTFQAKCAEKWSELKADHERLKNTKIN